MSAPVRTDLFPEIMPLRGLALMRWRLALAIYRLGCAVSGRHRHLMEWDEQWKIWACPHCGATEGEA